MSLTVHVGQNLAKKIYEAQIWNEHSGLAKVAVQSTRVVRSISKTNTKNYCESHYSSDEDLLRINMSCCPSVSEDVRLQFHCSSNKVPRGYEACAFYFWYVLYKCIPYCPKEFKSIDLLIILTYLNISGFIPRS